MKNILLIMLFSLFSFGAQAVPMTWTDSIDFTPDIYFGYHGMQSYTYTHDLTNDGFNPATDTVGLAGLSIGLYDDGGWFDHFEYTDITVGGQTSNFEIDFTDIAVGVSATGLISLNANGLLDVTINRVLGDFYLGDSTLAACGQRVAEPASFAVLILGVMLLVLRRRRV